MKYSLEKNPVCLGKNPVFLKKNPVSIHSLFICLFNLQNRGLLDTLGKLKSSGVSGDIVVFNTLAIGHTKHTHEQRISSWLLKKNEGI